MTVFEWIISANDVTLDKAEMKDVVTAILPPLFSNDSVPSVVLTEAV